MSNEVRTERLYNLHDQVMVRGRGKIGEAVSAIVWGYEWSDGSSVCGRPSVRYHGWFYHTREEGSGDEAIVPEDLLEGV